jgi:hypothetical protein
MSDPRAQRLAEAINRLRSSGGPHAAAVDLAPATAYEALTRQLVEQLGEEIDKLRGRLDGLLWAVVGAVVLDVVLRLAGVG